MIITVPEMGSALNSFLSPLIYEVTGKLFWPLFVGVIICIGSFIAAFILAILDKKR
jgi:hypothetical protein